MNVQIRYRSTALDFHYVQQTHNTIFRLSRKTTQHRNWWLIWPEIANLKLWTNLLVRLVNIITRSAETMYTVEIHVSHVWFLVGLFQRRFRLQQLCIFGYNRISDWLRDEDFGHESSRIPAPFTRSDEPISKNRGNKSVMNGLVNVLVPQIHQAENNLQSSLLHDLLVICGAWSGGASLSRTSEHLWIFV